MQSKRPYRLWNPQTKSYYPHRFYVYSKRAHMGALIEGRWSHVGTTVEVVNHDTGRLLGQYTRRINGIEFKGESHGRNVESRATSKVRSHNGQEAQVAVEG